VEVDDRGHFTIRNLAAGTYFVTPNLSVPGDMKPVGPPQQVVVNDAATVNVTLTADLGKRSEPAGRIKNDATRAIERRVRGRWGEGECVRHASESLAKLNFDRMNTKYRMKERREKHHVSQDVRNGKS